MGYGSRAIGLLTKYYEGALFSGSVGGEGEDEDGKESSSDEESSEDSSEEESEDEEDEEDEGKAYFIVLFEIRARVSHPRLEGAAGSGALEL